VLSTVSSSVKGVPMGGCVDNSTYFWAKKKVLPIATLTTADKPFDH
jgi:hypothetical protein